MNNLWRQLPCSAANKAANIAEAPENAALKADIMSPLFVQVTLSCKGKWLTF